MSNPNVNPITNPLSAADLIRILQEGYAGNVTLAQLAAQFGGAGLFGVKSPGVFAQSGVAASVTGTTAETVLATFVVPANSMAANGMLRLSGLWNFIGTAGTHTINVRLGGTLIMSVALNATSLQCEFNRTLRAANAMNAQVTQPANLSAAGSSTANILSTAIDMTQAQSLTISAQLGSAADTATLQGYTLEVLNP